MLLDGGLASLVVHQVAGDQETRLVFLLNLLLGVLGVFLLFGEIDNCEVGALASGKDRYGPADAGTGGRLVSTAHACRGEERRLSE